MKEVKEIFLGVVNGYVALYTRAATNDKKVLDKVLTVNVKKAVTIRQQWYQGLRGKKGRIKL